MHQYGFEGSYEEVETHEASCSKAPQPELAAAPAAVDVNESLFHDSSDEDSD